MWVNSEVFSGNSYKSAVFFKNHSIEIKFMLRETRVAFFESPAILTVKEADVFSHNKTEFFEMQDEGKNKK